MVAQAAPLQPPAGGTPHLMSGTGGKGDVLVAAAIVCLTLTVFHPVTRNGFLVLGFDDALILDTPEIRGLNWPNLAALATQFNHAHYMPLTMLLFALDYHLWGSNPWGYHVISLLLHAAASVLFYLFLRGMMWSVRVAAVAAAIFAVHPLQLEAVSLAVQAKTVLAGALWFLTLILYQRWHRTDSRIGYVLCLLGFVGAALAKPAVMPLPFLLLLYECFTTGRLRWRPILPFFAVAGFVGWMAVRAHAAVGAVHPLHGGTLLAHLLMVSRVLLEYAAAAFLPLNLSPVYYYRATAIYEPVNFLALALIPAVVVYAMINRHRYPCSFFCLAWFILALLPESNVVPLAQLRADRFLYLALPAVGLWAAYGWERLLCAATRTGARLAVAGLAPLAIALLSLTCYRSVTVWHDDVSAWTRVAERHPWCAVAHQMLGRAYYEDGDAADAEHELRVALELSDRLADTYLYLAKVLAVRGAAEPARAYLRRFLELQPGNAEGLELLSSISPAGGA